jgi:CRISPR system Cascade subunit CasC
MSTQTRTPIALEIHFLQNVPASRFNGDDLGYQKNVFIGGVERIRGSSQSWKYVIRQTFREMFEDETLLGYRTRQLLSLVAPRVAEKVHEDAATVAKVSAFGLSGLFGKLNEGQLTALYFASQAEIDSLVEAIAAHYGDLRACLNDEQDEGATAAAKAIAAEHVKHFKGTASSAVDLAFFGRMAATTPALTLPGAVSASHAFSTHRALGVPDFYTGSDDLRVGTDQAQAAMMGYSEFVAGCVYRYFHVDLRQLVKNLDGNLDAARVALDAFIRAAAFSMPQGKGHSYAHSTYPALWLLQVRSSNNGTSYADAFEAPVTAAGNSGLVAPSVERLLKYHTRFMQIYGADHVVMTAALGGPILPETSLDSIRNQAVVFGTADDLIQQVAGASLP